MENQIEHRGYIAKLVVDIEDNCIYATVINAEGIYFTAEGTTAAEVKEAFVSLIDDYLAVCEKDRKVAVVSPFQVNG